MLPLIAAAASSFASAAGQAMGGPNTSGAPINSWVDGSGWTVATGGSKARGSARSDSAGGMAAAELDPNALMWVGLALVAVMVIKKMGSK